MKVIEVQPVVMTTGEAVGPDDINEVFLSVKDAVADVAERRFAKAAITIPFTEAMSTPYTEATGAEVLTAYFTAPFTCVVERAFLDANLVSSAEVQVSFQTIGGAAVTGATAPLLTTGGAVASAADDTIDINVDAFVLTRGTTYRLRISSSGTFTLNRFDVTLHVRTDRWTPSGTTTYPTFAPTLVRDSDTDAAATVNANVTALDTEVDRFPANVQAPVPSFFTAHSFSSATDVDLLKWPIPRFTGARADCSIVAIYCRCVMNGTAGTTVDVIVRDSAGVAVETLTMTVAGVTGGDKESTGLAIALDGASTGPASAADDYTIEFVAAAAETVLKCYALVWVTRG